MSTSTATQHLERRRFLATARAIMSRCDELAAFSETPGAIKRTFGSPAMASVHGRLRTWCTAAGLDCRLDQSTNLVATYRPRQSSARKTLLMGSHLDTVRNAGKYDGVLGVLLGLGLLELLADEQVQLPFAIDVIAFCEEEGIRFATPFLGSLAASGQFDRALLDLHDERGVTLRDAMAEFGGDPEHLEACAYDPDRVLGYVEPHIEQGPVLDRSNLPLGVVSAIAGQTRAALRFVGESGHAGTVPIAARRDALVAAAEWIVAVERIAAEDDELFATVGCVNVSPNIANVIPGLAELRLDLRHPDDRARQQAFDAFLKSANRIVAQRRLTVHVDWVQQQVAVQADANVSDLMAMSVADCGVQPRRLPSGAGHDAAVMAARFPMAMLFLRCAGGVSHHPSESVREDDVALALETLWRFVHRLRDAVAITAPSFSN